MEEAPLQRLDHGAGGEEREWLRALGLFFFTVTVAASVVSPTVLMALPFVLLVLVLPARRTSLLLAAMFAMLFLVDGGSDRGMWYLERGWALLVGGWFLGLTLRWPGSRFFPRALGAVSGSFAVAAVLFRVQPNSWTVVDWMVTGQMRSGASTALNAFQVLGGGEAMSPELAEAIQRTVEIQGVVFPALVGLASVSALGVAWWCWARLAKQGARSLLSVREFRFNDQLVWVFVLGLTLVLLASSGPWDRLGTNTVVFMGALYALRGAGVLLFLNGGISMVGAVLLALALLFVAPVMAGGAMIVGLGDTWLDLRRRAAAADSNG